MRSWILIVAASFALTATAAHSAGFDQGYVARVGDFNGDGRFDIYLSYQPVITFIDYGDIPMPIATTKRRVGQFLLQQNASGSFSLVSQINANQQASISQWVKSAIEVVIGDVNADGAQDAIIWNIANTIPNTSNQIVFASKTKGAAPLAVRSENGPISTFVRDINGYTQNSEHYYDSAWVTIYVDEPITVYVVSCRNPGSDEPLDYYFYDQTWDSRYCQLLYEYEDVQSVPYEVFNTAEYSAAASDVNRRLSPFLDDTQAVSISAADVSAIIGRLTETFGIQFAPTNQPNNSPIEVKPDKVSRSIAILRKLRTVARGATLIGGLLDPTDTANDDMAKPYYPYQHYSYKVFAPRFAGGFIAPGYLTLGSLMSGPTAMQLLALPIKFPGDPPVDRYYIVNVPAQSMNTMIGPRTVAPQTWTAFGLTVNRGGQGQEWLITVSTPPGSVSGPFDLPASP